MQKTPLLQEYFLPDAWKVFVICMMLNCTQRKQVEKIIFNFFENYPNAETFIAGYESDKDQIIEQIRCLGFYNRRADRIYRFSKDLLAKGLSDPTSLFGVGKYATACYEMMFLKVKERSLKQFVKK
jgi:methyl-CpG-binding domain protein 4